jgi:hypothetical protein
MKDAHISNSPSATLRAYRVVVWVAMLWAVGNSLYVYLIVGGTRTFRVESAAFILAGVLLPLILWRPPPDERPAVLTQAQSHSLMLLAVGLWLLTLTPRLTLPFLSDDYVFLAAYRHWSDILSVATFFRPMFAIVFFLLATIGDGSVLPFHMAALLIHGASAWLVYLLARRLLQRGDAAALCFAVFLLNPLQLEAVLWASGLQELLWTFFVLAGLAVYTGVQLLSPWRLIGTAVLVACALLSKETAVSSVLLIPAADWVYFRMKRGSLLTTAYATFALIVGAYLLTRARVASVEAGFFVTPGRYFAQKFLGTPYKFFVQPWNLTAANVPMVVLFLATVIALAVLSWAVVRGTGPMVLVGPAVILISTLPVYSYFYVAPDLRATRYLYFAAVGWAVLAAQLLTTVFMSRQTFGAVLVSMIVISFASLQVNVRPWRTAGHIVADVGAAIRKRGSAELTPVEWQGRYGQGLEVKDGIPQVYQGVYVFVNGYPELLNLLTNPDARFRHFQ